MELKKLPLLFALAFVLGSSTGILLAQNSHLTISGHLSDAQTKEPLPFASIYIKGKPMGTTSNTEGDFVFHIPAEWTNEPVVLSFIGYEKVEKPASEFKVNEQIFLEPSNLQLEEVVVSSDQALSAQQIVRKAYKSIGKNYASEPYILEGFVRDAQNEEDKYVEFLEFSAKFYYNRPRTKGVGVELGEARRSLIAQKHPWNDQWERKNSVIDLLQDDFIRHSWNFIKGKSSWQYKVEEILPYGDGAVYKIKAISPPFREALLFIDLESYAFVRLEFRRSTSQGKYYKRRLTNGQQESSYTMIFEYQQYNDKMYLRYQREEDVWQIFDGLESDSLLFTKRPKKELFINNIVTENLDQYPFKSNFDRFQSIEGQVKPYDPEFWKHYNVPLQTAEESKIVELLKAQ